MCYFNNYFDEFGASIKTHGVPMLMAKMYINENNGDGHVGMAGSGS